MLGSPPLRSSCALLGLALLGLPLSAMAEDSAALIVLGVDGEGAQKLRGLVEEQLAAQGVRLLDPATTRACLKAFLPRGIERANAEEVQALLSQMGIERIFVVRQLGKEAPENVRVFQVQAHFRGAEPVIHVGSVPDRPEAIGPGVARLLLEVSPRQMLRQEDESKIKGPGET
ncbi:MAG: hypothetical protein U1E65_33870 [Myxococcota bacterium]